MKIFSPVIFVMFLTERQAHKQGLKYKLYCPVEVINMGGFGPISLGLCPPSSSPSTKNQYLHSIYLHGLTHWGLVAHICVNNLTIIGSDNGFSPGRPQVITWNNAGILLTWHLETNNIEILIKIHTLSFKKICLNMSWRLSFHVSYQKHSLYRPRHIIPSKWEKWAPYIAKKMIQR